MRRALGLGTGAAQHTPQQRPEQARQRHKFVQDGGVPVVMLNQKTDPETAAFRERITALETSLENERTAHAAAKRALAEQQTHAQALQTRLAHTELAHREAQDQSRQALATAQERLQEALAAATPARRIKPAAPQSTQTEPAQTEPTDDPPGPRPRVAAVLQADKPKRGRPRINPIPEPKPVRWWTPSFRAAKKK